MSPQQLARVLSEHAKLLQGSMVQFLQPEQWTDTRGAKVYCSRPCMVLANVKACQHVCLISSLPPGVTRGGLIGLKAVEVVIRADWVLGRHRSD